MCYNKETSLQTFSVVLLSCIFLFVRNYENDRLLALTFISISLMQLAEYFMWIDQSCGIINNNATKFALFLLVLQPLLFLWSMYLFGDITISKHIIVYLFLGISLLGGIITYYTFMYNKQLCSKPRYLNQHLNWDTTRIFNTMPSIISILFYSLYFLLPLLLLSLKSRVEGFIYLILYMSTLVYSLYLNKGYGWKSLWCYIVNYIPIIAIFVGWYFHK